MCTVTYIPLGNSDFILTSSRDIPFSRERAEHPKKIEEDGVELCYPKDGKAGGTWIGLSDKKRLICLLNGGFEYHTSRTKYAKSRGLIVKELLKPEDLHKGFEKINLENVEQFTLTIVDWHKELELIEFVWDGTKKHIKLMSQEPHIWSSSTLYDKNVKQLRREWFSKWQKDNVILNLSTESILSKDEVLKTGSVEGSQNSILDFHHNAGIGDAFIDLMMNRGLGGTVSITSVKKENNQLSMNYEDVFTKEKSEVII
jgi:hypothetical protein